ncbi:uncharacterized protein LOC116413830 isoform X2 [Galleria mellonella]|uniref:Uncharacterized protein LOC116413830 isoform X2 n=1 Tax=Galleria mellonella TaxID=7137 RepID=A0A6J3CG65_GALME|nr:uncharacterized protein LOC116413830 isoform X2 [Galleria mellonella]
MASSGACQAAGGAREPAPAPLQQLQPPRRASEAQRYWLYVNPYRVGRRRRRRGWWPGGGGGGGGGGHMSLREREVGRPAVLLRPHRDPAFCTSGREPPPRRRREHATYETPAIRYLCAAQCAWSGHGQLGRTSGGIHKTTLPHIRNIARYQERQACRVGAVPAVTELV